MGRKAKPKDIRSKLKEANPEFVEVVDTLSVPELEKRVSDLAKNQKEIEDAKANDDQLKAVADQKKEMEAPYKESYSANKLKMRYLLQLMEEKGA